MEPPVIKKGTGLSPVWILPLVALCISGWLLYTTVRDAGIPITIHFANAEGITAGKTQVMYKGVPIGQVEQITVDEDLQGVNLKVKMEKKAHRCIVVDTKFWIVKPEISIGKVSGLETILSGSYIAVQPGSSSQFASRFEGSVEGPPLPEDSQGLRITLQSDALYSLQKDSPVYTKNLKIGRVLRYYLADDRSILIDLYIEPKFSHLIQMGTRFWNSSGISFEGSLQSGFSLKLQSLAALLYGGISCGTPEPLVETSPPAVDGLVYKLYPNYEAAEYWLPMSLKLASGEGIIEGKTKVMFRGLEAGVVRKIRINNDKNISVTAEILLDPRAEPILKKGTRFWVVRPEISLDRISDVNALITGAYITFMPGEGVFQDQFVVEKDPMPRQLIRDGVHFTLVSQDSGFLEPGSPVLFNRMNVGEVYDIDFDHQLQAVQADIVIYDEYTYLVRKNSVFWNSSGIRFDAGFSGVSLDFGTLKSLWKGGISLKTPKGEGGDLAAPAAAGSSFTLYPSLAEAAKEVPGLHPPGVVVHLETKAEKYYPVGALVLYRKVPVGEVLGSRLSKDLRTTVFDVLLYRQFADLINSSTFFYDTSGLKMDAGLRGIEIKAENIASIMSGSISFMTPEKAEAVRPDHTFPLYGDYDAAMRRNDIMITLHLNAADGVGVNTKIRYQGIVIGSVRDVRFEHDIDEVIATVAVQRETAVLFRETSLLWLVRPTVDLKGVHNLATALTGAYINVIGGSGALRTEFDLLPDEPMIDARNGLNIILEAVKLGYLNVGSPVFYRQIQVGRVTGYKLSSTAQNVLIEVNIFSEYERLVHGGTKFWLASGIKASWDLFSGLKLDTESVEALLSGGIAFATPEGEKMGEPAKDGDHFQLHEKKESTWASWAPELELSATESQVDKAGNSR